MAKTLSHCVTFQSYPMITQIHSLVQFHVMIDIFWPKLRNANHVTTCSEEKPNFLNLLFLKQQKFYTN